MSAMSMPLAAGLAAFAAGGVAYVLLMPLMSGERRAEKRMEALGASRVVMQGGNAGSRREQVAKSLKELEAKKNNTKVTLELKILRAGLTWSRRTFFVISALIGLGLGLLALVITGSPFVALAALFAGALGMPRWLLAFLQKRRVGAFVDELPNAVDVVVRGIRSGIPLGDCLRIIAREAREPLRGEFKSAIEAQQLGLSMGDAILRIYDRVPASDVNFFAIVIGIQEKSGGNLSEALSNLSRVLRDRRKMAGKIQAMSMEAKASAVIIASLPFAVALMTYFTSPDYISLLWTTPLGKICLVGSAIWMATGVFTMKKMINFDF